MLLSFLLLSSVSSLLIFSYSLDVGALADENIIEEQIIDNEMPLSSGTSSVPPFTEYELMNNPGETVTFLDFYDFQEAYECDDIMVGLSNETGYLFRGTSEPWFSGFYIDPESFDGLNSGFDVIGLYPAHLNGIDGRTTDIFFIESNGEMFYYQNAANTDRDDYQGSNANWQEDSATLFGGNIRANAPKFCKRVEFGGKYNVGDEFVIGLGAGDDIYYVITEDTQFGTVDTYEEKLILDDLSITGSMSDLEVGDLDNDGDTDIVVVWEGDEIYVIENDGTPGDNEWTYNQISSVGPNVISLDLADIDLDGDLDIITGSSNGEIRIWNNDGSLFSGTVATRPEIEDIGSYEISDVKSADFDNDGDNDVIAAVSNGSILLLENPIHQPFVDDDAAPFSSVPWDFRTISSHSFSDYPTLLNYNDMDLDGDLDIMAAHNDGTIYGYKNELDTDSFIGQFDFGPKQEMYENQIANSQFEQLSSGDLDNDGDVDIALSTSTSASVSGQVVVLQNPGDDDFRTYDQDHTWISHSAYTASGADYYDLHVNDIDSDGYEDIAFVSAKDTVESLENDGTPWTGTWSLHTLIDTSTQSVTNAEDFLLADLDKDGNQEIIWASASTGTDQGKITAFRNGSSNVWSTWSDKVDIATNPTAEISKYPIMGYFDNDNYLDLAVFDDEDQILLIPGSETIDTIVGSNIDIVWDGSSGTDLTTIALSDIDSDQRLDIFFASSGTDKDVRAILNDFSYISGDPNWNSYDRCSSDTTVNGIVSDDLNMDGIQDIVFWAGSELHVFEGNNKPSQSVSSSMIEDLGSTIQDVILEDIDIDGDQDIVVTTANNVYYFPNRLREDVNLPDLDLTIEYSGNYAELTINSNETLYRPPEVDVALGSSHTYAIMTVNPTDPLEWTYQYYVARNGTYDVTVNSTDLYGNFLEINDQFTGYHYLALMNISIQGTIMQGFTNETAVITITNSSLPVYSDYDTGPMGDLLVNITDPSMTTIWREAVYRGNGMWNLSYNPSSEGSYSLGLNITDADGIVYTYLEETFVADFTDPTLNTQTEPGPEGEKYYTMDGMSIDLEFDEPIKQFHYYFTRWNDTLEIEERISGTIEAPGIQENGNQTIKFSYEIPERQDGDMNITMIYMDRSGNFDTIKVNLTVKIYLPVLFDFDFRDAQTGTIDIEKTNSQTVLIGWFAINSTEIQYKVVLADGDGTGTWSEKIPYNDIDRLNYPITLGTQTGTYNVTVRFYNYHNYVEITHQITYEGPSVSPFPWWWFVIAAAGILVIYIVYKAATKPKEKSWKRYLDQPVGDIKLD